MSLLSHLCPHAGEGEFVEVGENLIVKTRTQLGGENRGEEEEYFLIVRHIYLLQIKMTFYIHHCSS